MKNASFETKQKTSTLSKKSPSKKQLLSREVEHIDIKKHNVISLVEDMSKTAFQARNLARAAFIYDEMLKDKECSVILCLAGSLFSAGLRQVVVDLIQNNIVR